MMITLFTIVHYRYHPTPDTRERGGKWPNGERRDEGDSLVGFVLRGDCPSPSVRQAIFRLPLPLMTAADN